MDDFENMVGSVESAPESVDLDTLLGIEDIVMDNEAPAPNAPIIDMAKDNIEVDEPHIKIPTKKLIEVLSVSSQISSAGENSFEAKVVCMKVIPGKVRFLLSDNKRYIERDIDLINTENQFEGFIAFNTSLLVRLSKVCTSIFTLVQRDKEEGSTDKKYVLKIRGGEIALDNIKMQQEKFDRQIDCDNDTDFSKAEIMSAIKKLASFASTSIRTGKSLDFMGKVIQASPINCLAKVYSESEYPSFKISLTDAKILNTLCGCDDSTTIKISKDGKVFVGSGFKFKTESFPAATSTFDSVAERMFAGECVEVDAQHLIQITDLSCGLDTSTGSMKFNYTDDGLVHCELLTKRENSSLVISGNANTNVVKMENDTEVSSFNLKGALTIFSSESVLKVYVSPDGIALEAGNVKAAILGKNAGK